MTSTLAVESTRELVLTTTAGISNRDASVIDQYVAPHYKEHAQMAADGPDGLRSFIADLPEDFGYERLRVIADDSHVVIQGIYHGFGPDPLAAFDIWKVEEGLIVEHWDALATLDQPRDKAAEADEFPSVTEAAATEASRDLVTEFVTRVLVGNDSSALPQYLSPDGFTDHRAGVAAGIDGFAVAQSAAADQGQAHVYTTIHQVVAEGDFVFTRAEGTTAGAVSFNDLWRVADGLIVEHWSIIEPIENEHPHNNGAF